MDNLTEVGLSHKETEAQRIFGPLPDARPIQREMANKSPLGGGITAGFKYRAEGRSDPSATPESLFSYYLNNYEVARRHLEELATELGRPLRVLEVGCGTGWGSRYLSDNLPDSEFIATNRTIGKRDREILDTARAVYSKAGLTFSEADAAKLLEQYGADSFDAVVMLEVIEHLPKEQHWQVAQQVASILRPGGVFLVSTPAAEGYGVNASGPQSRDHVWVYGNRQDINSTLSPYFPDVQVNRIVNKKHTQTFGHNTIKYHFYSLGVSKAPEEMYSQYTYEKGNGLTDEQHKREQDTSTWFTVGKKAPGKQISETGNPK